MFQRGFMPMYGMSNMYPSFMTATRGPGLFSSLRGASLFRGINWGGLLNNAQRALGVVNQAIPLVRQVGPMFNNMKSMLKLASIFKDETDDDYQKIKKDNDYDNRYQELTNNNPNSYNNTNYIYSNQPNFFI